LVSGFLRVVADLVNTGTLNAVADGAVYRSTLLTTDPRNSGTLLAGYCRLPAASNATPPVNLPNHREAWVAGPPSPEKPYLPGTARQ